jgi:glycosyltransferase involved in cell wall biosynthesis
MNILFLNSAKRGWGGNEKSIQIAASALSGQHTVILGYRSEEIGRNFDPPKYRLPFLFEGDLYTIASLVRIVKKHRIDVIVSTKRKDYAIGGVVARMTGAKNIIWLGANRKLKNTTLNRLVYGLLASGIIVNARRIQKTLLETPFMQKQNIRVIYNGIDIQKLDLAAASASRHSGIFTITAMGRIDQNKGFDFLMKSYARFLAMEPGIEAKLVIIGDGPSRESLEVLARQLDVGETIRFTGFLQNPYPELCQSDVYASTSISEGLSIALLEAMYLSNAPVSTFAGGGVTEIITHGMNGYLLEHGDESALSAALLELYRNKPLRRDIAAKAKQTIAERYSVTRMAAEISGFCAEV